MDNFGLVSIITPSYNSSSFIAETIESILSQTYLNWELLITDDCSTDRSVEIIERYIQRDSRIKLFRLEKNCGAGVCRNRSISEAKGRFIAFCDSDDRWRPEKLEKQLAFMREKDCALSYTSYMTCDESGKISSIVIGKRRETYFSMRCDNRIGCLTAVYDTEKKLPAIIRQTYGNGQVILSGVHYEDKGAVLQKTLHHLRLDSAEALQVAAKLSAGEPSRLRLFHKMMSLTGR